MGGGGGSDDLVEILRVTSANIIQVVANIIQVGCKYNTGWLDNISSTIPSTSSILNIGSFFWLNPAHKLKNTVHSTIVLVTDL